MLLPQDIDISFSIYSFFHTKIPTQNFLSIRGKDKFKKLKFSLLPQFMELGILLIRSRNQSSLETIMSSSIVCIYMYVVRSSEDLEVVEYLITDVKMKQKWTIIFLFPTCNICVRCKI